MALDKDTQWNMQFCDIVNAIQSNMDAGEFSCGVFIDLKKAFDTVDHGILLLKSYLRERIQVTVVGSRSSNESLIT